MKKVAVLTALVLVAATACQNRGDGQLVGVKDRPKAMESTPFGMVYVNSGHFNMGIGGQDVPFASTNQPKSISIDAFWMDETEITNNEYRQFVYWVRDSLAHVLLGEAEIEEAEKRGHYLKYGRKSENEGEVIEPKMINWDEEIPWSSGNEEVKEALSPLYTSISSRFYHYRSHSYDISKFNYEYWEYDLNAAARKENQGSGLAGLYANRPGHLNGGNAKFIKHHVVNIYPDTLCWIHDFAYSYNENMTLNYWGHPDFDNYPVVGVSWIQAKAFNHWRTELRENWLPANGYYWDAEFRLPNEAEWEYASRGGHEGVDYPWGGQYASNANGCFLSNFKPQRGNYYADGFNRTTIVAHYHPNDYGLFDMSGNVAEWCADAFDRSATNFTHDLNPYYTYDSKETDSPEKKRKVIRGGSWKDVAYYTTTFARDYEYQDTCTSYVGFRCVQSAQVDQHTQGQKPTSHLY